MPPAPPVPYSESANYWSAGPKDAPDSLEWPDAAASEAPAWPDVPAPKAVVQRDEADRSRPADDTQDLGYPLAWLPGTRHGPVTWPPAPLAPQQSLPSSDNESARISGWWIDAMALPPQLHQSDMAAKELGDIYKPVPRDLSDLPPAPPPPPYPWYTAPPIPNELPGQHAIAGFFLDPTIGTLIDARRALRGEMSEEEQKDFAFQRFLESLAPPAKAAAVGMGASRFLKAAQLAKNKAVGAAFEGQTVQRRIQRGRADVVEQLTVKTQSGKKSRLDIVDRDPVIGTTECVECKGSATAPLTSRQRVAHPEIAKTGATVIGKGKPGFPGGTVIPPTTVKIIRP